MNFDKLLEEAINSLDEPSEPKEMVKEDKSLKDILYEIKSTEEHLSGLKEILSGKIEELCATVSAELKKLLPKVDAKLSRGSVIFSYYARSIKLRPDVDNGVWKIEPGQHPKDRVLAKKFSTEWDGTELGDWKELIHALAELFVGNYKTLQGGKVELKEPESGFESESDFESEISNDELDQTIDKAINAGAESPTSINNRPIERKGISKAGSGYYA